MAKPAWHALASLALGSALVAQGAPLATGGAAAVAGLFVDIDHLLDASALRLLRVRSVHAVPLHSWELLGALAALAVARRSAPLAGVVAGLSAHYTIDLVFGDYRSERLWLVGKLRRGFHGHGDTGEWVHEPLWRWFI